MTLHPSTENVFTLADEETGDRYAIIVGKDIYALTLLSGEKIAELFNGTNRLPIVPNVLKRKDEDTKHLCHEPGDN